MATTTYSGQEAPGTASCTPDTGYLRTLPGVIKLIILVLNFLGFICIMASPFRFHPYGAYFALVACLGLCGSGALLGLHVFHEFGRFPQVPWLKVECVTSAVWIFLYLVAASIAVSFRDDAHSAAGFFGYLAMLAYGAEAYLKFRALRALEKHAPSVPASPG